VKLIKEVLSQKFYILGRGAVHGRPKFVNFGIKSDWEDTFYSHFAGDNDALQVAILGLECWNRLFSKIVILDIDSLTLILKPQKIKGSKKVTTWMPGMHLCAPSKWWASCAQAQR
jgi:hypothetical protein